MSGALGIQFYYADGGQVIHCVTRNMSGNAVTFYYSNQGTVTDSTCQGNIAGRKTTGTVVENNEVYGASAEGVGLYDGSTDCTVAHNVIHDNYSVNLYLDSISHSTFDGNLIYETDPGNDLEGIEISDEGHYSDLPAPVNSYNTIINNVVVGHNLGIVFWYSGEWSTQALNDESGLRYDVISNNTLVNNKGSLKWDASPAHVGTTIQNNVFVAAAGTIPVYLLQAKSAGGIALDHNLWMRARPDTTVPLAERPDRPCRVRRRLGARRGATCSRTHSLPGRGPCPLRRTSRLTMGSPAIGVGVTLAAVPDDFLGAPRPSTGFDLGAFQYGAVAAQDGGLGTTGDGGGSLSGDAGYAAPGDGGFRSGRAGRKPERRFGHQRRARRRRPFRSGRNVVRLLVRRGERDPARDRRQQDVGGGGPRIGDRVRAASASQEQHTTSVYPAGLIDARRALGRLRGEPVAGLQLLRAGHRAADRGVRRAPAGPPLTGGRWEVPINEKSKLRIRHRKPWTRAALRNRKTHGARRCDPRFEAEKAAPRAPRAARGSGSDS